MQACRLFVKYVFLPLFLWNHLDFPYSHGRLHADGKGGVGRPEILHFRALKFPNQGVRLILFLSIQMVGEVDADIMVAEVAPRSRLLVG